MIIRLYGRSYPEIERKEMPKINIFGYFLSRIQLKLFSEKKLKNMLIKGGE